MADDGKSKANAAGSCSPPTPLAEHCLNQKQKRIQQRLLALNQRMIFQFQLHHLGYI
jgi:hypothetical protein